MGIRWVLSAPAATAAASGVPGVASSTTEPSLSVGRNCVGFQRAVVDAAVLLVRTFVERTSETWSSEEKENAERDPSCLGR